MIQSINTSYSVGKPACGLVHNGKSKEFPEGNFKFAWDRQVNMFVPHTTASVLKLKSDFHNSKLTSIEKDMMDES